MERGFGGESAARFSANAKSGVNEGNQGLGTDEKKTLFTSLPSVPSFFVLNALSLTEVWIESWASLVRGVTDRHHAFHTPILGTAAVPAFSLRTVVLRGVQPEEGLICCHTDWRSPKVAHIQANPEVQWLFYDPVGKVQLRLRASAQLHHQNERAAEAWQHTTLTGRRTYAISAAPGFPLAEADSGLPPELLGRSPTVEESEQGWPNFAVIETRAVEVDWLYLCANGNRRAIFTRNSDDSWQQQWVVP